MRRDWNVQVFGVFRTFSPSAILVKPDRPQRPVRGSAPRGVPMQSSPVYYVPDPIHPLMATIAAPACVLGDRDGQIRPQGVQGLYVSDMRVLHGAVVTVDGKEPISLDGVPVGPNTTRFHGVVLRVGEPSPDPKVRVDRTRTVHADGMDEELVISSTSATPVEATVALRLGADLTTLAAARAGRSAPPVEMSADGTVLVP